MDITGAAALSTYLSRAQNYTDVGYAVMDMSMDALKAEGAAMVNMMDSSMELSVNPSVGGGIDLRV